MLTLNSPAAQITPERAKPGKPQVQLPIQPPNYYCKELVGKKNSEFWGDRKRENATAAPVSQSRTWIILPSQLPAALRAPWSHVELSNSGLAAQSGFLGLVKAPTSKYCRAGSCCSFWGCERLGGRGQQKRSEPAWARAVQQGKVVSKLLCFHLRAALAQFLGAVGSSEGWQFTPRYMVLSISSRNPSQVNFQSLELPTKAPFACSKAFIWMWNVRWHLEGCTKIFCQLRYEKVTKVPPDNGRFCFNPSGVWGHCSKLH